MQKKLLQSLKFIIIVGFQIEWLKCAVAFSPKLFFKSTFIFSLTVRPNQTLKRCVGEEDQNQANLWKICLSGNSVAKKVTDIKRRVHDNHLQSFPCRCSIFFGWSMSHQSLLSPPLMQSSIFNTTFTRFAFYSSCHCGALRNLRKITVPPNRLMVVLSVRIGDLVPIRACFLPFILSQTACQAHS